jgi:hypothetical protein
MNTRVNISRYPDDQICMRASIGGAEGEGYYLMMRLHQHQNQTDMIQMLETVTEVLKIAPVLDVESPDPGKFGVGAANKVSGKDMAYLASFQLLATAVCKFKLNGLPEIAEELLAAARKHGIKIEIKE